MKTEHHILETAGTLSYQRLQQAQFERKTPTRIFRDVRERLLAEHNLERESLARALGAGLVNISKPNYESTNNDESDQFDLSVKSHVEIKPTVLGRMRAFLKAE